MWLHTDKSFVSIVAHRAKPGAVIVRARSKRDLLDFGVPEDDIFNDRTADYYWRAEMSRQWLADRLTAFALGELTYTNVKTAVKNGPAPAARNSLMHDVWQTMLAIEDEPTGRPEDARGFPGFDDDDEATFDERFIGWGRDDVPTGLLDEVDDDAYQDLEVPVGLVVDTDEHPIGLNLDSTG